MIAPGGIGDINPGDDGEEDTSPRGLQLAEYQQGEPHPNPPQAMLVDRVLLEVRQARLRQDEEHGMLRDYRDGTAGTRYHGPALTTERQRALEARQAFDEARRTSMHSWRHFLEIAVADAFLEANPTKLKARLVEVAATACAWAEGIEIRADEKRIAIEQKAMVMTKGGKLVRLRRSWWERVRAWFSK